MDLKSARWCRPLFARDPWLGHLHFTVAVRKHARQLRERKLFTVAILVHHFKPFFVVVLVSANLHHRPLVAPMLDRSSHQGANI